MNCFENKNKLLKSIQLYLFDMDGTLYLGNQLFDFTPELLQTIKSTGRRYLFMTNNSSKSVDDYVIKLGKLGISATREDFITSSQATAYYLKENYPNHRLYVCGTNSLKEELKREGFVVTENLSEVDCIVMGFDTELTFKKLEDVSRLLLTRENITVLPKNILFWVMLRECLLVLLAKVRSEIIQFLPTLLFPIQ